MLKRFGLPMLGLLAMLAVFTPGKANAGVRIGVAIGPSYPVPAPAYAYANPYPDAYYGYARPVAPIYPYAAPVYRYDHRAYNPHDFDRRDWRAHARHEREYYRDRR